jgi:hypothetical protein
MSNQRRTDAGPANSPIAPPPPLGQLSDLAELLGGDSARSRRFLGGLVAGAVVGAAVAGGSLFRRRARGGGA